MLNIVKISSFVEAEGIGKEYWNSEEVEAVKPFDVIKKGFVQLEISDKYNLLIKSLVRALLICGTSPTTRVLCVGAGSCWVEFQALKMLEFKDIVCVDFSKHRIHQLAPVVAEYSLRSGNVTLIHGSLESVELSKFDIIILCQAFHHFEVPTDILVKIRSNLAHDGRVIIVGEHHFSFLCILGRYIKHFVKYTIDYKSYRDKTPGFLPTWRVVFPVDSVKGDHHYSKRDYISMFGGAGFYILYSNVDRQNLFQSFILASND